jgi:hypothetical protein
VIGKHVGRVSFSFGLETNLKLLVHIEKLIC